MRERRLSASAVPGHGLEQQTGDDVVRVRVGELLVRREVAWLVGDEVEHVGRRPRPGRVGEHRGPELAVGVLGDAAAVGEELADRHTVGDRQRRERGRRRGRRGRSCHRRRAAAPSPRRTSWTRSRPGTGVGFEGLAVRSGGAGRSHGQLVVLAGDRHARRPHVRPADPPLEHVLPTVWWEPCRWRWCRHHSAAASAQRSRAATARARTGWEERVMARPSCSGSGLKMISID